jgi:hypothetical protein
MDIILQALFFQHLGKACHQSLRGNVMGRARLQTSLIQNMICNIALHNPWSYIMLPSPLCLPGHVSVAALRTTTGADQL